MRSIWSALKGLAAWQILVLIVVLFGAAGATYGGYIRANGQESVELAEDQQLIPIRYGNLVNEVLYQRQPGVSKPGNAHLRLCWDRR